jgi:hypothetical protein
MSFKDKLLHVYFKYHLTPTSLSRELGYDKAEKIARLTRDENNLPGFEILSDLINYFKDINPRWWFTEGDMEMVEESRSQYGFCKECIKKDGIIEFLKKECAVKDKTIEQLKLKGAGELREADGQTRSEKKAS